MLVRHAYFLVPALIGIPVGSIQGGLESFHLSRKRPFVSNVICTTGGILTGGFLGGITGLIWPISVLVFIGRLS